MLFYLPNILNFCITSIIVWNSLALLELHSVEFVSSRFHACAAYSVATTDRRVQTCLFWETWCFLNCKWEMKWENVWNLSALSLKFSSISFFTSISGSKLSGYHSFTSIILVDLPHFTYISVVFLVPIGLHSFSRPLYYWKFLSLLSGRLSFILMSLRVKSHLDILIRWTLCGSERERKTVHQHVWQ